MRLVKHIFLIGTACFGMSGAPLYAKETESLSALEKQLAFFLGKEKGEVGGVRNSIDPRLRLKKCTEPAQFEMRNESHVVISCAPHNWRISIALKRSAIDRKAVSARQLIVKRGQPVLLVIEKNGFMISRQMRADRNGGMGDVIPARAARRSSPILVEITGQGRVSLPSLNPSYSAD